MQQQLKDPDIKEEFDKESAKLKSAIALTKVRKDAGLSQRKLAEISNVPQSTIARIERGDNTSMDTFSRLAEAMGKN